MKWVRTGMVWCSAYAGYMLFAGTVSSHELGTSAGLAAGAVTWAFMILHCSPKRFAMTRAHAFAWLKAIGSLVPSLGRTLILFSRTVVLGGSPGRAPELTFIRGADDDPEARARRASALLIASLAPDSFAVRAPPDRDRVLLHTILQTDATRDPRWLTS